MPNYTENYNLEKPIAESEHYDINVFNDNFEAIDQALTPTADPAQIPTGNGSGKLVQWVSWITNRIKAITGKADWKTAPATTLEGAKNHIDASAPHSGHETPTGAQTKADSAESNANSYTDGAVDDLAGAGRTTETVKQNANNHAAHLADGVKHVTQAEKDIWNNHNHDTRYIQTRIYNGVLQYYDGGWKDVASGVFSDIDVVRGSAAPEGTLTTVINYSGAGVLMDLGMLGTYDAASCTLQLIVDGVTIDDGRWHNSFASGGAGISMAMNLKFTSSVVAKINANADFYTVLATIGVS